MPAWRLEDLPDDHVRMVDLLIDSNLDALLDEVQPRTVFNCVAYGAYSFETDSQLIYRTNFNFITRLLARLEARSIACYVHAGSSSEYGDNAAGPAERRPDRAQQRLRRLQGRRGQPDPLLRQAQAVPLRQPAALFGLRPARRLVAADPQRDPPRPGGQLSRVRQPGHLARLRLRRRRDRGVRRHRAEPRPRPTTASRSTSAPAARRPSARSPRPPASCSASPPSRRSPCPTARWDVQDWYANIDKARDRARLGSRGPASTTACDEPPTGIAALPDKADVPPVVQEVRPGHGLQRQRDHRLLQGQPGDPDHVRAAQGDVHQAEHRLRDHLRQRLQPRRHRGGDPRASRGTTGG